MYYGGRSKRNYLIRKDIDLCNTCYQKEGHNHKMDRKGLDPDDDSSLDSMQKSQTAAVTGTPTNQLSPSASVQSYSVGQPTAGPPPAAIPQTIPQQVKPPPAPQPPPPPQSQPTQQVYQSLPIINQIQRTMPPVQLGVQRMTIDQPQVANAINMQPPCPAGQVQHSQALQQLLETLKSPNSPQQQQEVITILKTYPQLMTDCLNRE